MRARRRPAVVPASGPAIDWAARPVLLVGGGPSAGTIDIDRARGRLTVVAINDSARALPWADALFTADVFWLRRRREMARYFAGARIVAAPAGCKLPWIGRLDRIERRDACGLPDDPNVSHAGNSGRGALTHAVAAGAIRIALVGYDMTGPGHWHGGYEWTCRFGVRDYPDWAAEMTAFAGDIAARGVSVVNLNPASAIRCFGFATLDAVLDGSAWD